MVQTHSRLETAFPVLTLALCWTLLRQMGAYAHALALLYPDRRIDTALLWTRTATLMPLPHALVSAALARATGP